MARFDIQSTGRFQSSSTAIRRPKEIACFSYDDERKYHCDDRSISYYYPPKLGADLSRGFSEFKKLDDTADDHLDSLLRTLIVLEQRTGTKCEADIITWRGMVTKIMTTPGDYMRGSGFEMNATCFQGTMFIEENHDFKLKSRASQNFHSPHPSVTSQDTMNFWGYKFEALSLIPNTWHETSRDFIESREEKIVNNHSQYCSVVKTGIGKAKMIIGGEVDGVWDIKPNWIELKTSACIENDKDMLKFERKLQKFWAQSFLLGVPKIIVGFRTRAGILDHIEEFETVNIPGRVKRNGLASWDGNRCINFVAALLEWLKTVITTEGVWRISRKERSQNIEVSLIEESGFGHILSEEFLTWRRHGILAKTVQMEDINGDGIKD